MLKKYYLKHKEEYKDKRRNLDEVLYQRWRGILSRTEKITKNHSSAFGKGHMSKEEFFKWANNDTFKKLYLNWKRNKFNKNLSPSIDRIDLNKGYFLDNIQWITMRENNLKKDLDWKKSFNASFRKGKKVRLWKEDGTELFFDSGKEASIYFKKNRLAVTNNIIMGHKLQGWNCEWI
jgi:hypothetical protein